MSKETVVIAIDISAEAHEALDRLRLLLGHESIESTIVKALSLYGVEFVDGVARMTIPKEPTQ